MNEEDLDDSFQLLLEDNYELKTDSGSKSKSVVSGVSSVVGEVAEEVPVGTLDSVKEVDALKTLVPIIPAISPVVKSDEKVNSIIDSKLEGANMTTAHAPVISPELNEEVITDHNPRLTQALTRFYEVYNPENLNKVCNVSAKFSERRAELWEQLSIKYSLSVCASCKLFIELFVDDTASAYCYLFNCPPLFIRDDSLAIRGSNWRGLLGLSDTELCQKRELYDTFLKDVAVVDEAIMRDVSRTHQENAFFHDIANQQSLKNVLSVFTRVNGVPYVQGMNEVAAILLFTVRSEGDSFWLFNEIMSQLREVFISGSDSTQEGVYSQIDVVKKRLEQLNPSLYRHLVSLGFPTETVFLKWITTLLSMELTLPDSLKLWDTLLMSLRTNTLRDMSSSVVLGYLTCMQDQIMEQEDLESCMPFISTFGKGIHMNVDLLVLHVTANYAFEMKLRGKYIPTEISIILEQITDAVQVAKDGLLSFWEKLNTNA